MDRFWAAPPVSRTLVAAMAVTSLLVHGGLLSFGLVLFTPSKAIWSLPPQIWRFATSFLVTGPGLSFLFDLYFTWIYATGLELNSPRFSQPGDFFVYLVFIASVIVGLAGFLFSAYVFTSALTLALIYTFAQDNRGTKAHFILFQIPVEYLPWATLALTLIMGGPPAALIQGSGIIAAHAYDFLTRLYPTFQGGRNVIQTPVFVKRWFGVDQSSFAHKKYGSSFRPGQNLSQQGTSSGSGSVRGWTSGFSGSAWSGRGQGRRLGSD